MMQSWGAGKLITNLIRNFREHASDKKLDEEIKSWKDINSIVYDSNFAKEFHLMCKQRQDTVGCLIRVGEALMREGLIKQDWVLDQLRFPTYFQVYRIYREMYKNCINDRYMRHQERLPSITRQEMENLFLEKTGQILTHSNYYALKTNAERELDQRLTLENSQKKREQMKYVFRKILSLTDFSDVQNNQQAQQLLAQPLNNDPDIYLVQLFERSRLTEDHKKQIDRFVDDFVNLLREVDFSGLGPKPQMDSYEQKRYLNPTQIQYTYFGSQLNGFGTVGSDVDFSLLTSSFVNERDLLRCISSQIRYNRSYKFDFGTLNENLRIPLIGVKKNDFELDLCVNNILGIANTKLNYTYSQLHPKVQQGGVLLKLWGKQNKVISKQSLSSYAIILMWISFLQNKYDLPILQQVQEGRNLVIVKRVSKDGDIHEFATNLYFLQDKNIIEKVMRQCKQQLDSTPLCQLLEEFWRYYQIKGEYHTSKKQIAVKYRMEQTDQREIMNSFKIKDPFDKRHDPGQKINQGQFISLTEGPFKKAQDLIIQRRYQSLFESR